MNGSSAGSASPLLTAEPVSTTTAFAKRNPLLAKFVPDILEDALDACLPDSLEEKLERGARRAADRYTKFSADFHAGFGEVAAALLRVCKYAFKRFGLGDVIFGVYHLAQHHASTNADDAIEGTVVTSPVLLQWLLYCCNLAIAAYAPTVQEFAAIMHCKESDVWELQPATESARPAYAVGVDHKAKQVVLAFRGTTDLNDMLTDACASCVPYCGGYAHFGMLKAARWFVKNKLPWLREICDMHPGYGLLLVGHSLGAGTATLLAHLIRRGDPDAGALMKGIKLHAVGIATPAVLTADLAEGCNQYISSVVLQFDLVPRFSVYNVFLMKEEMDAINWTDKVLAKAADWAVPDIIEHTETYQRLAKATRQGVSAVMRSLAILWLTVLQWVLSLMQFAGIVQPNRQLEQEAKPAGEEHKMVGLGDVARATASAATLVLHHPRLALETMHAIEKACAEAAQGDIHAMYAPGRLYFLKRTDPPKEKQEALRQAAQDRAAQRKAERRAEARAAGDEPADSDSEPEDLYPGSTFELIRGSKEQRFKRIVLQKTCIMDHMCSAYVQGVQQLLEKHKRSDAVAQA